MHSRNQITQYTLSIQNSNSSPSTCTANLLLLLDNPLPMISLKQYQAKPTSSSISWIFSQFSCLFLPTLLVQSSGPSKLVNEFRTSTEPRFDTGDWAYLRGQQRIQSPARLFSSMKWKGGARPRNSCETGYLDPETRLRTAMNSAGSFPVAPGTNRNWGYTPLSTQKGACRIPLFVFTGGFMLPCYAALDHGRDHPHSIALAHYHQPWRRPIVVCWKIRSFRGKTVGIAVSDRNEKPKELTRTPPRFSVIEANYPARAVLFCWEPSDKEIRVSIS